MANALGTILQVVVIVGFIIYSYSIIRGQTFGDTLKEIKELIQSMIN